MKKEILILQNKAELESILSRYFSSGMFSADGFFTKKIESENSKTTIFIAEAFYYRMLSHITLTVIVEETADKTTVEIISSGGNSYWGFSYGAQKDAIKRIVRLLKENGFTEQ